MMDKVIHLFPTCPLRGERGQCGNSEEVDELKPKLCELATGAEYTISIYELHLCIIKISKVFFDILSKKS